MYAAAIGLICGLPAYGDVKRSRNGTRFARFRLGDSRAVNHRGAVVTTVRREEEGGGRSPIGHRRQMIDGE